jgi:hypothetical protein
MECPRTYLRTRKQVELRGRKTYEDVIAKLVRVTSSIYMVLVDVSTGNHTIYIAIEILRLQHTLEQT